MLLKLLFSSLDRVHKISPVNSSFKVTVLVHALQGTGLVLRGAEGSIFRIL